MLNRLIDYYEEKSKELVNKDYNELIKGYGYISDHLAIGSNCFVYELNVAIKT